MEGKEPQAIANSEGKRTTPSLVAFLDNREHKVESPAKRQAKKTQKAQFIQSNVLWVKHSTSIQRNRMSRVICGDKNTPNVKINYRQYTPQEISSMILQKMKKSAEDFLDQKVTESVITGVTFDISILKLVYGIFEVKSIKGDTHLGGDDLDHKIIS